uniref:Uncharacterized protein n=2 Tax=Desulfobacterium TaxID=2295 RepID=E1YAH3_9BACT|nr:hypothetical protein N47_H23890 [uncultured Desulfobacterium sp.]
MGENVFVYMKNNFADLPVTDMIIDHGIDGFYAYGKNLELLPEQKAINAGGFSETDRDKKAKKLGAGQYKKNYILLRV